LTDHVGDIRHAGLQPTAIVTGAGRREQQRQQDQEFLQPGNHQQAAQKIRNFT
jgi:hypothetical protein